MVSSPLALSVITGMEIFFAGRSWFCCRGNAVDFENKHLQHLNMERIM